MAAELAAKKNNLAHVEVKEYVSPALQKPEEGGGAPQTGNSMMAMIMAQRNKMKNVGGAGKTTSTTNAATAPKRPSAAINPVNNSTVTKPPSSIPNAQKRGSAFPAVATNTASKPTTNTAPKPSTNTAPKFPPSGPKPATNTGSAKPPIKNAGGGGGGFAAKMAALQARMGGGGAGGGHSGATSSTPASTGPSKPIVELCEGNTKRMDINKVIGNLEKEKKKQASKSSSSKPVEVKVVSGKGKGIPPPPPPPPPPPKF